MNYEKGRYRFVGKENNNGPYDYSEGELVIPKKVFEIIGEQGIKEMRSTAKEVYGMKQYIYGKSASHNQDDIGLPDEIFFEDTLTGAIISFTHKRIEETIEMHFDDALYYNDSIYPEKHLKSLNTFDKNRLNGSILESPTVVEFRPELHSSQIK